jgi:hypothetical protein
LHVIIQLTSPLLLILQYITGPFSDSTSYFKRDNMSHAYSEKHMKQKETSSFKTISLYHVASRKPVTHSKVVTGEFKDSYL